MLTALDAIGTRKQVRVIAIDGGHGVRSHLNLLGIHVGDWLTVVERAPFRGPVLVEINGSRVAIGRAIAAKVRVDADATVESLTRPHDNAEAIR